MAIGVEGPAAHVHEKRSVLQVSSSVNEGILVLSLEVSHTDTRVGEQASHYHTKHRTQQHDVFVIEFVNCEQVSSGFDDARARTERRRTRTTRNALPRAAV